MKSYDSFIHHFIQPYLRLCDRFFPLAETQKGGTVEFRSRSLILVFAHVAIVLVLQSLNSIVTVGFWSFMKGFFFVDLCFIATLGLIFYLKKPERLAGPYMGVFMLGVALIVVFSGKTPVTSLGSWWPLWIFWTITIAGAHYSSIISIVAAISAAIFLFGAFLGTPNAFDFGLTAEGWALFLLVDITFVSLVGHMVTTLFQHFLQVTHRKWLQARNNANLEIRFRMLSRFARHIYEALSPEIKALQGQCANVLEAADALDKRPDRLAELQAAKQKIDQLALLNHKMLAFTESIRTDKVESIVLGDLIQNTFSMLETLLKLSKVHIAEEAAPTTRIPAATGAVVQLFLASVFLSAHGDSPLKIEQLRIYMTRDGLVFLLEGKSRRLSPHPLAELCHDCHRLLEAVTHQSDCVLRTESETFSIHMRVRVVS